MFIHEIQSYYEQFSHAHVLKTHRYHNKIQAPFLSPFKHQKWNSRLGVASTIYSLPINCLRCRLEMHIYLSIDLINQKLTYFGANVWGRSSTPTIKAHPNWGWVVLSQLCQNTSTGESSTLKQANISNHPHLYTNFTTFSILARYQPGHEVAVAAWWAWEILSENTIIKWHDCDLLALYWWRSLYCWPRITVGSLVPSELLSPCGLRELLDLRLTRS